jgi:hypothetical protein
MGTDSELSGWYSGSKRTVQASTDETTAAAKVFAIPELLEQILSCVGIKQLFVLQRVCKNFQSVMLLSKALRQKMWIDSSPRSSDSLINPLALEEGKDSVLHPYCSGFSHDGNATRRGDTFYYLKIGFAIHPPENCRPGCWRSLRLCRMGGEQGLKVAITEVGYPQRWDDIPVAYRLGELFDKALQYHREDEEHWK